MYQTIKKSEFSIILNEGFYSLLSHANSVNALKISSDGEFLLAGAEIGSLHFWNIKENKEESVNFSDEMITETIQVSDDN